jgi:hypothetical protein
MTHDVHPATFKVAQCSAKQNHRVVALLQDIKTHQTTLPGAPPCHQEVMAENLSDDPLAP